MVNKKITELNEATSILDEDCMMIIQDGVNKKINAKLLKGAGNITNKYVELIGDDGEKYKLSIKNKKAVIYPSKIDTEPTAIEGENSKYDGLIINRMYGGGSLPINTAVSHGFIELYNMREEELNLKGLYLWYKAFGENWQGLELKGIIPARHSFLIRGTEHNDYHKDCVRCNIDEYDMQWNIKFSNQGFSTYLCIGENIPEANPVRTLIDSTNGSVTWTNPRYIDLLGCGGIDKITQNVTAFELRYLNCMTENIGVMREDFANLGSYNIGTNKEVFGNNEADCIPIDYSTCNIEKYRPKSLIDGEWTSYDDKIKLKKGCTNLINICYGENGNNARTFTWQTEATDEGYFKYRKENCGQWIKIKTNKKFIRHKDCEATIHSIILKNLAPGIYEYKAGEEGLWSDIETFEVKEYNEVTPIKMLLTTDEQGWNANEYKAVKTTAEFIEENENFDFHLNCGDISQNGNKSFEWRYYFDYYKTTKNIPHMMTCGNNDLVEKKYSDIFNWYATYENQVWNSVHSWDLGFAHFVCLNSNTDYTYVAGDGSVGGYKTTDAFLQAQCEWLDNHLTQVENREEKPRWVICYMHCSPFSVGRAKRLQRFIAVFEKHKVDLVLCGHNHAYSRSKALYTGYDFNINSTYNDYVTKINGTSELKIVDELNKYGAEINRTEDIVNGTYYILAQATGFKLKGKEQPITLPENLKGTKHDNSKGQPWWIEEQSMPSQPCYITADIGWDSINLKMFYVDGVLSKDENGNIAVNDYNNNLTKREHDTLTINYSDRNKE